MSYINYYQDAFFTPGNSPFNALSLKQILQIPKSLIKPLVLPHNAQRLTSRVLNFCFFPSFTIVDFFDILFALLKFTIQNAKFKIIFYIHINF